MGISFITISGLIVGVWAMLSLMGSERQRELVICKREVAEEAEALAANPPPLTPPAAKTPVAKIPVPKPPAATAPAVKTPTARPPPAKAAAPPKKR
jgi:hypothetical protein